jgi:hypothetical protein
MCYVMPNAIYIPLQRYKLWIIMDEAYNPVWHFILSTRLMHGFVAYCCIVMSLWQYALLWVIGFKRNCFLIMLLSSRLLHPWAPRDGRPPPWHLEPPLAGQMRVARPPPRCQATPIFFVFLFFFFLNFFKNKKFN